MKRRRAILLLVCGCCASGALSAERQKATQDIAVPFDGGGAGRVVFSHERHFGAMAEKNCAACHAEAFGLGQPVTRRSFASRAGDEPHGTNSLGRFCANCHRGGHPPPATPAFSALGPKGADGCAHCHAPPDHGQDFTRRHGDRAEHGAGRCAVCHRGSIATSQADRAQVQRYREAQRALLQNPDDKQAFAVVMPNNFCAYCHAGNGREAERSRDRERQRRGRERDD